MATLHAAPLLWGLSWAVAYLRRPGVQSPTGALVFAGSLAALSGAAGLPPPPRLAASVLSGTLAVLMLAGPPCYAWD